MMTKSELTHSILTAKTAKNISWETLAGKVGRSPVWVTSCCLGMNSMPEPEARQCASVLGLGPDAVAALQQCPNKLFAQTVPTDPLIYRFYEIMGVYGETIKAIIHEKFGDGIMSAIDFTCDIEKVEDPKGDRVRVIMNGKFLSYKKW